MTWIVDHWPILSAALVAVATVLNAVTKHYTEATSGLGKALLWLSEMLSLLASKDVPGQLGKLKLPLTSTRPQ